MPHADGTHYSQPVVLTSDVLASSQAKMMTSSLRRFATSGKEVDSKLGHTGNSPPAGCVGRRAGHTLRGDPISRIAAMLGCEAQRLNPAMTGSRGFQRIGG